MAGKHEGKSVEQPVTVAYVERAEFRCKDGCHYDPPGILAVFCTPQQIREDKGITFETRQSFN